jgi:hypothetical protein
MLATRLNAWLRPALTMAATAAMLALTACGGGSGAPNNPYEPPPVTPGPLTVVPVAATAFAGNPLVLSIGGGTPPYSAFSSNPAVLPVPQAVNGSTLPLLANNLDTAQVVTVTIRDSAGSTAASEVTVRPSSLLPTAITVTGNPNCAASGGTLCSGQNGTASVSLTGPAGSPLPGRQVRFDVVQGDFTFVSANPGQPLVGTLTVVSDQNGFAVVTLQAPSTALTQVATIRATDVTTGQYINSNFTIVAFKDGSAVLSVSPAEVTVPGLPASPAQCPIGVPVTYFVYGGTPPYRVTVNLPTQVTLFGSPIPQTGGSFTATTNGCVTAIFTITDASNRFINATLTSVLGPDSGGGGGGSTSGNCGSFSPPNPACPTITSTISLTACTGSGSSASATIFGGTGPFTVGSITPSGIVDASISGTTLTVTRTTPSSATGPVTLRVNAGSYYREVTVNATPANCP